jgi:hypothetical protein
MDYRTMLIMPSRTTTAASRTWWYMVGDVSKVICVRRPVTQSLLITRPNAVGSWEHFGNRVANMTPTPLLFQCKAVSTHLPE